MGNQWAAAILVYLVNPYSWVCALAWLAFFYGVVIYLRCSTALSNLIYHRFPDLRQKLYWGNRQRWSGAYSARGTAPSLDRLILFNAAANDHPSDPEFRALLSTARWAAAGCLLAFSIAVVLLGVVDTSVNHTGLAP